MKPGVATAIAVGIATGFGAGSASAQEDSRLSGAAFMGESTRAMQQDDTRNPAMLWVAGGEALWGAKAGTSARSCADCHGDAAGSMRGAATRYPAHDPAVGRVVDFGQRINYCREQRQQAAPLKPESEELLGLLSYLALQSRGMPMDPPRDATTASAVEQGRRRYFERIGQLNLSCAQCHDDNWGRKLGSASIPQGHANAYPIYRLEWQSMGSLQRRLRNCMSGVRAEIPPYGSPALVELEAYLASRAAGMPIESPGVRP